EQNFVLYLQYVLQQNNINSINYAITNMQTQPVYNYLTWVKTSFGNNAYNSLASNLEFTRTLKLNDWQLYGSSRLGVYNADTTLTNITFTINGIDSNGNFEVNQVISQTSVSVNHYDIQHELAYKQFELTNHLGNVLATVLDRKTNNTADVVTAQHYYPFGSVMSSYKAEEFGYRYGFNGKEKKDEIYGIGNTYDYGARIYDSRLGRFMSIDPEFYLLPSISPFSHAINSPLMFIDKEGKFPKVAIIIAQNESDFSEHKAALEAEGYKVVFVKNGQQALDAMKALSTPKSPIKSLVLLSHGSPGGISSGGGGIFTQSELEIYAKQNWSGLPSYEEYIKQNNIATNFEDPNFDWEKYDKEMEGYNDEWKNLNFEKNKGEIVEKFKKAKQIVTLTLHFISNKINC
ncbi:MAG: hypothetical protein MUC81_13905, partial [Bacteroidia bacterium]|nr:hypothetical protein [Bacteroidia bacterium]